MHDYIANAANDNPEKPKGTGCHKFTSCTACKHGGKD